MRFEWDETKNKKNLRKHRISFEVASEVFLDPFCMTITDQIIEQEERLWTIGRVANSALLVVVHTIRDEQGDEVVRIISARRASPRERGIYEKTHK